MELNGRIGRLERYHRTAECLVCHGEGKLVMCSIVEGEEPPEVPGCEGCGKARRVLLVWCDEALLGQPKVSGSRLTAAELIALHGSWNDSITTSGSA